MFTRWGSKVEHRGPTRKAAHPEVGSECAGQHLPGSMAGQGAPENALRPRTGPCCPLQKERGTEVWRLCLVHCHPHPLGTRIKSKLLFFEVLGTIGSGASGGTEQRFSNRPSSGRGSGAVTIS